MLDVVARLSVLCSIYICVHYMISLCFILYVYVLYSICICFILCVLCQPHDVTKKSTFWGGLFLGPTWVENWQVEHSYTLDSVIFLNATKPIALRWSSQCLHFFPNVHIWPMCWPIWCQRFSSALGLVLFSIGAVSLHSYLGRGPLSAGVVSTKLVSGWHVSTISCQHRGLLRSTG